MRKVLILFEKRKKKHLADSPEMKKNFEELFEIGMKNGIKYFRASISRYSKGIFKEAWTFRDEKWVIEHNVAPDIVFDRSTYLSKEDKIKEDMASRFIFANDPMFYQVGKSKFLTYLIFRDLMPETRIAYSMSQLINNLKYIKGKKIVIKPDIGAGGKGVELLNKSEAKADRIKINKFPIVIQEFIDSSKGINGLVKGIHDLRIIFFDDKPFMSYIRQPRSGYIANYSRGGTKVVIPLSKVPKELFSSLGNIISRLNCFNNKFYSVDFFFDQDQKYHIIEINPSPSIRVVEDDHRKHYYEKLSKYFLNI